MTDEKGLITIDTNAIIASKDEAGNFLINPKAEEQINKIFEAQEIIEAIIEHVKSVLQVAMAKEDIIKIEGAIWQAVRRYYGARFEVIDKQMALDMQLATVEERVSPDSKAIEKYMKEHEGQLPECIKLRDRSESLTVTKRKNGNETQD